MIHIGMNYNTIFLVQRHIWNSYLVLHIILHLNCLYYTIQNNSEILDANIDQCFSENDGIVFCTKNDLIILCKGKMHVDVIYNTIFLVQLWIVNEHVLFYVLLHFQFLYYTLKNNSAVDDFNMNRTFKKWLNHFLYTKWFNQFFAYKIIQTGLDYEKCIVLPEIYMVNRYNYFQVPWYLIIALLLIVLLFHLF